MNFLVSLHVTKGELILNKVDWNWCARFLRAKLIQGEPCAEGQQPSES